MPSSQHKRPVTIISEFEGTHSVSTKSLCDSNWLELLAYAQGEGGGIRGLIPKKAGQFTQGCAEHRCPSVMHRVVPDPHKINGNADCIPCTTTDSNVSVSHAFAMLENLSVSLPHTVVL